MTLYFLFYTWRKHTLGESGLASGGLAQHRGAAQALHHGLCVAEDGGDLVATWRYGTFFMTCFDAKVHLMWLNDTSNVLLFRNFSDHNNETTFNVTFFYSGLCIQTGLQYIVLCNLLAHGLMYLGTSRPWRTSWGSGRVASFCDAFAHHHEKDAEDLWRAETQHNTTQHNTTQTSHNS